ncbi:hypothetical protein HRbin17_00531 [bacterium HR17]|uniref:Uncharacterized protein n=1 Tax=Candidatus Fervidibacter japonicus TaxID=2035412 RepID=A0A2H5XA10_9BACT|nr:hypothetical protein HRbin17_00531 [bacterium HR17]
MLRLAGFGVIATLTLLTAFGCGGHSGTMPSVSDNQTFAFPPRGGQPPSAPQLIRPNEVKIAYIRDGKIRFVVRATDPEGDRLKYRIVLKQNGNVIATFDQTVDPTGWSKPDYGSGEYAILAVPIPAGSYEWNAQAFDGSTWGAFHNTDATFIYAPK